VSNRPRKTSADGLRADERRALQTLASPAGIQAHLDEIPYSAEPVYRSPRQVLADRKAHCFDGAVFAAAALRYLGFPPLLMDLGARRDDDHVLCLFRRRGLWGALAKSNCSGLRYREPIHRTLRELAMTYFEDYFNTVGEKSLRSYSTPVDLSRFEDQRWEVESAAMDRIAAALDAARHFPLLPAGASRRLAQVDKRSYAAGFLGSDQEGLYRPPPRKI